MEINYPIGAYAPGSYVCTCSNCEVEFIGDKRSVQCEPCAINMLNSEYKKIARELSEMKRALSKIKEGNEIIDSLINPKPKAVEPGPDKIAMGTQQGKFECYEIHTVQARMYGCDKQCEECKAEEFLKKSNFR